MKKDRLKIKNEEFEKNKDLDFLGTNAYIINEKEIIYLDIKMPLEYKNILKKQNCFIYPSTVIKKRVLLEIIGYRNFSCLQDYD